mmetsp:Transcript_9566/g.14003  ORF Transcript_9566/g.14003 Transcript_9566/m.14003 type:complete len:380 (+) Transcript_9566:1-1140(+)
MPSKNVFELLQQQQNIPTLRCTQRPGDLLYLPDFWGHSTLNHGFGIGVAAIVGTKHRNVPGSSYRKEQVIQYDDAAVAVEADNDDTTTTDTPSSSSSSSLGTTNETTTTATTTTDDDQNNNNNNKKQESSNRRILFVHINKAGGSSMIQMLQKHCSDCCYQSAKWKDDDDGVLHRTFHLTAHAHIVHYGRSVWNDAVTFAIVRHPLARQVSNFFFLLHQSEITKRPQRNTNNDRLIPTDGSVTSESPDEVKIRAFHEWIANLYEAYPNGHYLFGSKGHGNEVYLTFNATQTSWLVDETGQAIVVERVIQLEELSNSNSSLSSLLGDLLPCLNNTTSVGEMSHINPTPPYPHYTKFKDNATTNRIMKEVYAVDYANFGYE